MSKNLSYWFDLTERSRERAASGSNSLVTIAMCGLLLSLAGCSSLPLNDNKTDKAHAFVGSGLASYYDDKYQNKKTASGEIYQHELKTAAHRSLPFGSIVRVTNQKSDQSVLVKINDRGPFVRGRIIDLSKSAFTEIGNLSSGLLHIDIQVME